MLLCLLLKKVCRIYFKNRCSGQIVWDISLLCSLFLTGVDCLKLLMCTVLLEYTFNYILSLH